MIDARDHALQASCPVLPAPRFGDLPSMANGQRILVAANGVFVQVRLDWLDCIHRLAPAVPLPLPYGDVRERMAFSFGRLPIDLIEQFVEVGRRCLPRETAGALIYSRATGRLRLVMHSADSASPAHIGYRACALAADETLAVDLHTHGTLPAFFSATDDRDDTGIKVAGVFGNLDQSRPSARFRLVLNGVYRTLPHPWQRADAAHDGAPSTATPAVERHGLRWILRAIRRTRWG